MAVRRCRGRRRSRRPEAGSASHALTKPGPGPPEVATSVLRRPILLLGSPQAVWTAGPTRGPGVMSDPAARGEPPTRP